MEPADATSALPAAVNSASWLSMTVEMLLDEPVDE